MRIALISSSYHPYPGGVEEHTRNVARELTKQAISVTVWTVDRGEHLGTQRFDGITVRYLPTPLPASNPRSIRSFARSLPSAWSSWSRALSDDKPDILHVQCFGPNGVYALALHLRHRVPLIVSSHGETFGDAHDSFAQSWLLRRSLRCSFKAADVVTGCSQMVIDDLVQRFGLSSGIVVPNGVDLDEAPHTNEGDLPSESFAVPTIFAVGRIERNKGFDLLMNAFARADLPPAARLVIGGDGSELPTLRKLANDLGIQERVEMPGRLSRGQVIAAMKNATMVVVPSRVEAFGIVVLEAWRSGSPLVATSRGGTAELVTDGVDGLLVDPVDTAALAGALSRVLSNPELAAQLAKRGLETVRRYTWSSVVERYITLYTR